MKTKKTSSPKARWVTVPVEDALHVEVKAEGVRRHQAWPVIVQEALKLWLSTRPRS